MKDTFGDCLGIEGDIKGGAFLVVVPFTEACRASAINSVAALTWSGTNGGAFLGSLGLGCLGSLGGGANGNSPSEVRPVERGGGAFLVGTALCIDRVCLGEITTPSTILKGRTIIIKLG